MTTTGNGAEPCCLNYVDVYYQACVNFNRRRIKYEVFQNLTIVYDIDNIHRDPIILNIGETIYICGAIYFDHTKL